MAGNELEALYGRYASKGDIGALAEVFDRVAPDLARLGRMLVGDRQRAEDLVQETFLTAVEQPATYDRSRPLKPWLVGILVNRARTARRAAGQEFEADRLTEREVASPDAEATRQEYLAAVSAAVAELPAKLRTVVEARLAGKETSELARELGISQGALRVRLHRALQRMRALLPPGFASAFAIMFLHSQGLAQVRARILAEAGKQKLAAVAGGSAAAIGMGSVWMTKNVLFAVSLAGLLLVGAGLRSAISFVMADTGAEQGVGELALVSDDGVERDASTAATAQPELNDRTELASVTPESEVAVEAAPTHSLSGKVLGQDDRPVAGVSVTAWDNRYMRGDPRHAVKTNAAGEFSFPELGLEFVITAQSENLACEQGLRGTRSSGSESTGLVIRVTSAAQLAGIVVDPAGAPVAGALVTTTSGLDSYTDTDLTEVSGIRTFAGGKPPTTESASDGRFTLGGLHRGSHSLSVKKEPYLVARNGFRAPADDLRIQLGRGLMIRGHVVDSRGLPAEGARVRMWPWWSNVQTVPAFVTVDASGDFLLTSAVAHQWSAIFIGVIHEGHAIEVISIGSSSLEEEAPVVHAIGLADQAGTLEPRSSAYVDGGENVSIRLLGERVIAGHVVDPEGRALPGVRVWIEGEREMDPGFTHGKRSTWEWALGLASTKTDEFGQFRFERLYEGAFEIHAVSPHDKRLVTDVTAEAGDESVHVVMNASAARKVVLKGKVTDSVTGKPIEEFTVIPMIGDRGSHNEVVDIAGEFELAGYEEGAIELKIQAEGYAEGVIAERHYTEGEHEFDISLVESRRLRVSVVDSAGKQLGSGNIRVFDLAGEQVWIGPIGGGRSTNAYFHKGKAILHGLPAQPLTLRVHAERKEVDVPIDLTQPIEGEFEIVIDPEPEIPTVLVELWAIGQESAVDIETFRRNWGGPPAPDAPRANKPKEGMFQLDSTTGITIHDDNNRLVAEVSITPTSEGTFTVRTVNYRHNSGTSSVGPGRPVPVEFLELPAARLKLKVKASGQRDIESTLDLTGQPEKHLEIISLVRSGG